MTEYRTIINGIEVKVAYSDEAVKGIFIPLLKKLTGLQKERGRRILVMLAAPPGTGKSTLAEFLAKLSCETEGISRIQAVGMDGFHRRQEYLLNHYTDRDGENVRMVDIKGAPVTFDIDRLTESIKRIASGDDFGWPGYDRLLHNPVEDAVFIEGDIILIEGNYLLLDEDGWRELKNYADYTISIRAGEDLLRRRLVDRKIKSGASEEKAAGFVDYSDMYNVRICLEKTMKADLELLVDDNGGFSVKDDFEKKKELFLKQKETLDTFLKNGAISQFQYDKSYGDLVRKMGMENVAEEISEAEK